MVSSPYFFGHVLSSEFFDVPLDRVRQFAFILGHANCILKDVGGVGGCCRFLLESTLQMLGF